MASYFPLNDDIMAKQQCESKLNKQIRIIVVPRAGKINWPWSRSRSKQRSRHDANWKDFFQGSFMPNINVISLILQKIWAMLKFLWQTEGRTNKPIDGRTNGFLCPPPPISQKYGGEIAFWTIVVLIGSFACRARIDWCLAEFTVRYDWSDAFCGWSIFFSFSIF